MRRAMHTCATACVLLRFTETDPMVVDSLRGWALTLLINARLRVVLAATARSQAQAHADARTRTDWQPVRGATQDVYKPVWQPLSENKQNQHPRPASHLGSQSCQASFPSFPFSSSLQPFRSLEHE